ncbi:MAG: gephyrin-like molybdotransferase Glp [Anaerolineaceae bacterium]
MLNVKSIAEANRIILERFGNLKSGKEQVPLEAALNRILAEEVNVAEFVPDFNRSTVDGFAVRAQDVFGCSDSIPALLIQIGEARMGAPTNLRVEAGQCVYVPTGAEVPEGADSMIMLEEAENLGDGEIAVYKASAPGSNIIFRGDDLRPGDLVFPTGKRLNIADIGSLAAIGIPKIILRQPPRVAIFSTGDELIPPGVPLTPGKIRDVNAPMLFNAVLEAGGEPQFLGIIQDDALAVEGAVQGAIQEYDMLLISGGTSVGAKDAVPSVISTLGELLVHGVAAKPGKPTLFGAIRDKPVFGLPGNPVAAYFMFYVLVRPLLSSMLGTAPIDRKVILPVARAVPSNHGREEFVPVRVSDGMAHPIASKSGLITTLSSADGFLRIPRDLEGLRQGEAVEITLFGR